MEYTTMPEVAEKLAARWQPLEAVAGEKVAIAAPGADVE
jgi:fructose 1,6-bisphosphatase